MAGVEGVYRVKKGRALCEDAIHHLSTDSVRSIFKKTKVA